MKTREMLIVIIFFICTQLLSQTQKESDWQWQYPKPQGNTLRDIYVFNKDTAVAVGDVGTIIKTTDGGTNWDVQHHAGGTSINLYGVNFSDSQNGWAVGGVNSSRRNILLKTEDAGKNWTSIKTDTSLAYHAVYFVDKDTGFVVGEDGIILRTTNGGNNWSMKRIDDYVGYGWLDVFDLWAITFSDKQTGWIVGYGYYWNQIYKTTDCGRTWQWNESLLNPRVYSPLYDVSFIDKNNGCIVGTGIFLRTTDSGENWQQDTIEDYNYSVCFTDSLNGFLVGIGSYYPFINSTTDGGRNWTEIDSGLVPGYPLNKVRFSDKENGWIVGGEGMLYRTTNGGKKWAAQYQKPYNFKSIYFTNENKGWAVGDSGIILHTTNGGTNWETQNQNDSLLFNSVYAINDKDVFVVGSVIKGSAIWARAGIICKTMNGGQTWLSNTYDTLWGFNSITFSDDSTGWISVSDGTLLRTNNKGNVWFKATLDSSIANATGKIQFVNKMTGWIGSTLKTTDGGNNWKNQNIPSLSFPSIYFVNANLGWIVGDSYGGNNIYETTDGGNNWLPRGSTYRGYNFSLFFTDDNTGWIAGYNDSNQETVIKTTDWGNSWFEQDVPTRSVTDLFFLDENTGWAIGDGIFKTTNGGGIVSVKNESEIEKKLPTQIELYQNYPNPFNPSTTITYALNKPDNVRLEIYDILGRRIETLVNKWQPEGNYNIIWQTNNLSSGVYFYVLRVGEFSMTKKMLLLR